MVFNALIIKIRVFFIFSAENTINWLKMYTSIKCECSGGRTHYNPITIDICFHNKDT